MGHDEETGVFQQVIDFYKGKYAAALQNEMKALFGANGIVRVGYDDPAYRANKWMFDHATKEQKEFINKNLLIRHHLKTAMHEKWGISTKAPACVHEAMYTIIGADGSALADIGVLQKTVENIIKETPEVERKELIKAFYLPNGVLKEYCNHFKDVKSIVMPTKILTNAYEIERQKLNDLMCEQLKHPSKYPAIQAAREHLHDWLGAKNTKDVLESKGRFDRAYTNVFNTYPGGVPPVVGSANIVDAQSSMPMSPGPELEPKNEVKPAGPELQPKNETVTKTKYGAAADTVASKESLSLAGYDASLMSDMKKLEEAVNMFKNNPSAIAKDGPLAKLLQTGKTGSDIGELATARGAAYELERACDLVKAGEEVVVFGRKIGSREFDIETRFC